MKVIEINKKTNSKVNQALVLLQVLCLLNDIHLSLTDLTILAYYVVYQINEKTDALVIDSGLIKNLNNLRNVKTRLFNLGFLRKTKELYKTYELNLDEKFELQDTMKILIKVDNT